MINYKKELRLSFNHPNKINQFKISILEQLTTCLKAEENQINNQHRKSVKFKKLLPVRTAVVTSQMCKKSEKERDSHHIANENTQH